MGWPPPTHLYVFCFLFSVSDRFIVILHKFSGLWHSDSVHSKVLAPKNAGRHPLPRFQVYRIGIKQLLLKLFHHVPFFPKLPLALKVFVGSKPRFSRVPNIICQPTGNHPSNPLVLISFHVTCTPRATSSWKISLCRTYGVLDYKPMTPMNVCHVSLPRIMRASVFACRHFDVRVVQQVSWITQNKLPWREVKLTVATDRRIIPDLGVMGAAAAREFDVDEPTPKVDDNLIVPVRITVGELEKSRAPAREKTSNSPAVKLRLA